MLSRNSRIAFAGVLAFCIAIPTLALGGERRIVHLELKGPIQEAPADMLFNLGSAKRFNTKSLIDRIPVRRV